MRFDKEKYKKVKKIVEEFELGKLSSKFAVKEINKIAYHSTSEEYLNCYWRSINIDEFIKSIIVPEIENWKEIDDKTALILLNEMLEIFAEDSVRFDRICVALEKRYGKSSGTISDYVFYEDLTDSEKILEKLKEDTKLYL